jgi:tRNA/rRNA methyltransferase
MPGARGDLANKPARRQRSSAASAGNDERTPASNAEREALLAHLEQALAGIGFLSRQNPGHILADVRALFARAGLTRRDVKIWRGVARQMLWSVRRD